MTDLPQTRHVMMLADAHVDAIMNAIRRTHAPIELIGQGGRRSVFRIRHGKLYGYEITPSGNMKHEVMRESEIGHMMNRPDVSRPDPVELEKIEIRRKLREDHPDMTEDKIAEQADIIHEARKTALALVKSGIPPNIASKMVSNALRINDTDRSLLRNMATQYADQHREESTV
jgi:hypothetical protein